MISVEQSYRSKWLVILALSLLSLSSCNGRNTPACPPEPVPTPTPTPKENESENNEYLTIERITVININSSAPVETITTYEE